MHAVNIIFISMAIPWPWQFAASFLANMLALLILTATVIFSLFLHININGRGKNGNSTFFLRVRILIAVVVMPSTSVALLLGFRCVGWYFLWYGLSSHQQQLVTHRVWPTTFGEILFTICVILLSVLWIIPLLICGFVLIMGVDSCGNDPQQGNTTMVLIMTCTAVVTIFAGYVLGGKETGWYGAFPPDYEHADVLYESLQVV